jgi:hypothetical protein
MRLKSKSLVLLALVTVFSSGTVYAQQSSSGSYRVDETFFGSGGELDASSASYRAQQSAGALGVGFTSSASYDVNGGFLTQNNAYLEMSVENATVDFGTLSPSSTSYGAAQGGVCNCSFKVRTYLSSEYVVYSISDPPTNESGDILTAKAAQGAASGDTNVEEFGINVVANTSPATFGENPVNYPDNSFADGQAATGYQTTNQYKYVKNDIIARSQATAGNPATGRTDYTISYIAKINNITAAGLYTMNHQLVTVASF